MGAGCWLTREAPASKRWHVRYSFTSNATHNSLRLNHIQAGEGHGAAGFKSTSRLSRSCLAAAPGETPGLKRRYLMPTQQTVRYWTVCWKWGFIPYPCRKTRTEWCYQFRWLIEYRYSFFCYLIGCENGIRYCWYAFCFNVFGKATFFDIRKCFKNKRSTCGDCGDVPK